ncbi:MAG TPA: NADH-quinone oxidoreductase subunit C [Bacteriovoracaceae bacterium]|nr:NADH-quinone oxidoreductase subunit C [Bacteriovoracaceae bacterium]
MFNWKDFERTKQVLSHVGRESYQDHRGQHHIFSRPVNLLDWASLFKEDMGYLTLIDVVGMDHGADSGAQRFEIIYHLLNMDSHQRASLHLLVDPEEISPSLRGLFTNADWMEREQIEALDLRFDYSPEALLLPEGQGVYPLRKGTAPKPWPVTEATALPRLRYNPNKSETPYPEEAYEWKHFDLFSPVTRGAFEWLVCFDPNHAVDSQMKIGFHHHGFEKHLENKDYLQVLQLVDKINVGIAPNYSIAWAKNVEELYRIKLPERAQAVRIVMLELGRVAEHLTVLFEITHASGLEEFKLLLNAREKIYELFERYCGHRQGLGIARIGGVKEDLPNGWIVELQEVATLLNKNLRIIHNSLLGQRKFRAALEGPALDPQAILQMGVSGPAMRAAGLNFDLRKSQPFYFYQDVDFDIPVGIQGTSYDRYLIRYEEIFQSLRIITQVIDNLPLGEYVGELFDLSHPELLRAFHDKEQPAGWHYSALESPGGECGFSVLLGRSVTPLRIKIKTPSFSLAQALPIFTCGLREDQLITCLASLGLRQWEMDR